MEAVGRDTVARGRERHRLPDWLTSEANKKKEWGCGGEGESNKTNPPANRSRRARCLKVQECGTTASAFRNGL